MIWGGVYHGTYTHHCGGLSCCCIQSSTHHINFCCSFVEGLSLHHVFYYSHHMNTTKETRRHPSPHQISQKVNCYGYRPPSHCSPCWSHRLPPLGLFLWPQLQSKTAKLQLNYNRYQVWSKFGDQKFNQSRVLWFQETTQRGLHYWWRRSESFTG
jgi:hypothetical protein